MGNDVAAVARDSFIGMVTEETVRRNPALQQAVAAAAGALSGSALSGDQFTGLAAVTSVLDPSQGTGRF